MSLRVLVIDDHLVFAELLVDAVRRAGHECTSADPGLLADDALVERASAEGAAVVLLDLMFGPERRSLPLIERFVELGCEVIVLTADDRDEVRAAALEAGAVALLPKAISLELVLAELERIAGEDTGASSEGGLAALTPREQEVLSGLVAGQSAKDIAASLGVALPTVRTQLRSVYRKLGVHNARAAIVVAVRWGWSVPS
jgi:two-component system, NarL family, nitrate/nitrite response regulator NarL